MDTGLIITITIAAILAILLFYYIIKWRFENRFRQWLEVERQVLEQEKEGI
jgi:uncharacterized membrane protein SpoIIM required for sporulation